MLLEASLFLASLTPQGQSNAPVVINEFSYDDSGTDDREFVELYNRSTMPVDISNWVLDSEDPSGPNLAFTIPANTPPIPPGGFFVLGPATVPNVNLVVGTTDIWENSNESLTLRDNNGRVIDTLIYEAYLGTAFNPALAEGDGIWGTFTSIDGLETSWSRLCDGYDTDDNGCDFRMANSTPGTSNNAPALTTNIEIFDLGTVGSPVTGWGGTWKLPTYIDPTVVDLRNPNAIPASPQGGLAGIFWDESGGGNANFFISDKVSAASLEAYVYFDATPAPVAGQYQTWSFGFGTEGTYYNSPDPSGALGFNPSANGNAGVMWMYQTTDQGGTLYLFEHNDGGWGPTAVTQPTLLGQIAIQPGVNDGWQRLRISVTETMVEGRFGGTFGQCDGTRFGGQKKNCSLHGAFVGYREFYSNNSVTRPFTCDNLAITVSGPRTARASVYGNAVPNTNSTPRISTNGFPCLGEAGFELRARGLNANAIGVLVIGAAAQNLPLSPIGGQPNSALLVSPAIFANVVANGSGNVTVSFTPSGVAGARVFSQVFEADLLLPFGLKIAHTEGLELVFGNL